MKDITTEQAIEIGKRVIVMFNLKADRRDMYRTEWGTKSAEGIGRIVNTIMTDVERKRIKA